MPIITIWHNLAIVHVFCFPTVPTKGNAFQSTFTARTFRVQSIWAFRWGFTVVSDNVQNVTWRTRFICHNWDVPIVLSFQPQSSGVGTSEFKLFHSWSWWYTCKDWKWAGLFVGESAFGFILIGFASIFIYLLYRRSVRSSHTFPP